MTKLFFVRADNEDGENLDLHARADTEEEARKAWNDYYNEGEVEEPNHPMSCIKWVGEIPVEGPKGAISWGIINPT